MHYSFWYLKKSEKSTYPNVQVCVSSVCISHLIYGSFKPTFSVLVYLSASDFFFCVCRLRVVCGRLCHILWLDLSYENRRNYLFIEESIFWFYEKSFGKLVFDPLFGECSNVCVSDWLYNILSKWGLGPFFSRIFWFTCSFFTNLTKNKQFVDPIR